MHEIPIRACGVAAVVIRGGDRADRFLLLRRTRPPVDAWTYAAGSMEADETADQAAVREVKEETGLRVLSLYSADVCEQFYEINRDSVWIAPVFVAFVDGETTVVINKEHSEYRWCTIDQAADLMTFPGAVEILQKVNRLFVEKDHNPYLRIF